MVCNNVSTQFKMFQRPYMLSRACVQCHRVNVGLASLVCHGARLRDLCYKSPGKGKGCCKASWEALGRLFKAPGFRMPWVASLSQAFVRLIFWGSVWESKLRQLIKRPFEAQYQSWKDYQGWEPSTFEAGQGHVKIEMQRCDMTGMSF